MCARGIGPSITKGSETRLAVGDRGKVVQQVPCRDLNIIPGDDVSAAHATVTYRARSDTGEILRSIQNRLTWIAKRTDGVWKIVHQHTSVPIEPGTMIAKLHR